MTNDAESTPPQGAAVSRLEMKVEEALAKATAPSSQAFTKFQTWLLTLIIVSLQLATFLVVTVDIAKRDNRTDNRLRHERNVERQLEGIACVLITAAPPETRGADDAARCELDYIPGERR